MIPLPIPDVNFPPLARDFHEHCFPLIKAKLPLDFNKDYQARNLVDDYIEASKQDSTSDFRKVMRMIEEKNKRALIIAPGPTLEENILELMRKRNDYLSRSVLISVDGATNFLVKNEIDPDVIVTDLDGLTTKKIPDLAANEKSLIIIHAHGNNIHALKKLFNELQPGKNIIFTTQVLPTSNVYNWGGFTDGDRAVFCSLVLGFKEVLLVSMDLKSDRVGMYSKIDKFKNLKKDIILSDLPIKKMKMQVATSILKWLMEKKGKDINIKTLWNANPFEFIDNIEK
ncbi:MAG: 6-hydroxymethylpterin diphosphokinase MptE-like protein [Promethearchaeota archaeon]